MLQALAGILLNQVNSRKANNAAEEQAQKDVMQKQQTQQTQHILDSRTMRNQASAAIGLQGMDAERQAVRQKQQGFFESIMNKYGGGDANG